MLSRRTLAVAALLVILPLAGCVGSQTGAPSEAGNTTDTDSSSTQQQEGADDPGWIEGTVSGEDGPIGNALVEIVGEDRSYRTQEDGSFRFDAVPAGDHTLRYNHTHYNATTATVTVDAGAGADASATLGLRYLAPGVPAKYGSSEVVYDADDTIEAAFGPPGAMTVRTSKTASEAYWGYWKHSADEGFLLAYFEVTVTYGGDDPASPDDGANAGGELGLRYFWNEGGLFGPKPFQDCRSDLENQSEPENSNCGYNYADLVDSGDGWKTYTIRNGFLSSWGDEQIQIGVYPSNGQDNPWGSSEFFAGANVPYHITIEAYQVQQSYVEG